MDASKPLAGRPRWWSRVPRGAWVLAPLALAIVYALAHGLLRRSPDLRDMVPPEAIEVQRYRDLATYDAVRTFSPRAPRPSDDLGRAINLPARTAPVLGDSDAPPRVLAPALPGIDRHRPLLAITLDPSGRPDPAMFVLPVEDRAKARETWFDPDLPERHARHLEFRGEWAASTWDRDVATRAGRGGGMWAEERGEDWCRFADWPRLVDFAIRHAHETPFTGMFLALGGNPAAAKTRTTPDGRPEIEFPIGRAADVRDAWTFVALYGWSDRIRAELTPKPGGQLASALADLARAGGAGPEFRLPTARDAQAWLWVRDGACRRALALALRDAGVAWPDAVVANGFAALRPDARSGLVVWSELSPGALPYWTLGVATAPDARPPPTWVRQPAPPESGTAPLASGSLPLLTPYGGEWPSATAALRRRPGPDGSGSSLAVLGLGLGGAGLAERAVASPDDWTLGGPWPGSKEAPPLTRIASFRLSVQAAQRLLSNALGTGGLLSPLQGADVEGDVATDGTRLVLTARRAR